MTPGPSSAVAQVVKFVGIEDPPVRIEELLEQIILLNGWDNTREVDELVEDWLPNFLTYLHRNLGEADAEGVNKTYAFSSSGSDHIQGSCYVEPGDDQCTLSEKQRRSLQGRYSALYENLDPLQFESMCGKVLGLLKVRSPVVTAASSDQGVDFYGKLEVGSFLGASNLQAGAEKNLVMWLVGQAKHYQSSKVSTADIRELVGSVHLARSKVFSGSTDPLDKLQVRMCDPVAYLFFTTGRLTKGSRKLLKRSGVVAMDGQQLGTFLSDNEVGQIDGRVCENAFLAWLESP